jgi:hypothetical protein
MLTLFWVGAAASAYLGYRMHDWWVPAVVACATVGGQYALLQMAGSAGGPGLQLIGFGLMDVLMFYATFSIGRSVGQRFSRRRKGVR